MRRNAAPIATPTRVEARYPFSRYPTGHAFWATQSCMYVFDWYSADTADRSRTITTNWAKAIRSVVSTPSVFLVTANPFAPICLLRFELGKNNLRWGIPSLYHTKRGSLRFVSNRER